MRPPSYYASIVKSNNSSTGHSYSSPDYDPRTSSQQLRSSLSSPSSSSYVSRSHLPFVPQSTLVAHCFTGVGSSTRPYSSASKTSSNYKGANYTSPYISSTSSLASTSSSSGSSYLSSNSVSSLSSRQPSTKRAYSSSSYSTLRPSYQIGLTSSSSSTRPSNSATSRYRPTPSASSYYKPIRLRERPLLTQISRQIGSPTPPPSQAPRLATASNIKDENDDEDHKTKTSTHSINAKSETTTKDDQVTDLTIEPPDDWSSDIGRNISRNKYLIKFREIDKHQPGSRASIVDVEATIELPKDPVHEQHPEETIESGATTATATKQELTEQSKEVPTTTKLAKQSLEKERDKKDEPQSGEMRLAVDAAQVDTGQNDKKTPTLKKEKKNVKLKLRQVGGKVAPAKPNDAQATTTIIDKKPTGSKEELSTKIANDLPEQRDAVVEQQPDKVKQVKVKRVIKTKEDESEMKTKAVAADNKLSETKPNKTESSPSTTKTRPKKKTKKSAEDENATEATTLEQTKPETDSKPGKPVAPEVKASESASTTNRRQPLAQLQTTKQTSSRKQSLTEPGSSAQTTPGSPRKTPGRIRFREYHIDDFNFLTVLGHGGWGFVILAELKEHDACFAVKCIKKITIVEDDDYDSIMIERKVLALGNIHPFICKLFCTFETEGYLFFVMEYCAGGDLMFHVQHEGKFTESRCRFYAAEIICAIRFLHNRHIIYRDLKLDNILLDDRGHIRLVDFGMCQCRTYREEMLPSNFCGTPEYISPEIIKGVPYNHSVDWWSFGVLLYEMAVGKMPFRGSDENELLWNVCYEQIHYPMFLSKELTSLLKLLLEREPNMRMGMATCKAGDIYDQPYFRGVDWKAVEEMRVEPPFVPEVRSKRDVSNFDSDFTESTCELSPVDDSTLAKIDQTQFQQFPYTNPDIFIFDTNQSA